MFFKLCMCDRYACYVWNRVMGFTHVGFVRALCVYVVLCIQVVSALYVRVVCMLCNARVCVCVYIVFEFVGYADLYVCVYVM